MGKTALLQLLNALLLLGAIALLLAIAHKAKRGKKLQDVLLQTARRTYPDFNWVRIYLSRPAYFARRLKLVGFEGRGILGRSSDGVRIRAKLEDGTDIDLAYPLNDPSATWIGNPKLGSANLHWLSLGEGDQRLFISADTGFIVVQSREATADLLAMIAPSLDLPENSKKDFALEKNPASLVAMAFFFALLLFGLIDGIVLNPYELIQGNLVRYLTPFCFLLAFPSYFLLNRKGVPSRESLSLSFLIVLASTLSLGPILKRVDQCLSKDGLRTYEYTLVDDARLEPVNPGPPPLNFKHVSEYWRQYEKGSHHEFRFIHGPLGLWQLEKASWNEKYRRFYEAYDKGKGK